MASATFALTVRGSELPASWPARLKLRHPTLVQLGRYAIVGGAGTTLNVVLFLVARPWLDAVPANLVAIVVTTIATTEANRRFTFHAPGGHRWRTLLQNLCTVVFYAFYGSAVLMLLSALVPRPTELMESAAVVSASLLGGLARFAVMRLWEFPPADARPVDADQPRTVTPTSGSWEAVTTARPVDVEVPLWRLAAVIADSSSRQHVPPRA